MEVGVHAFRPHRDDLAHLASDHIAIGKALAGAGRVHQHGAPEPGRILHAVRAMQQKVVERMIDRRLRAALVLPAPVDLDRELRHAVGDDQDAAIKRRHLQRR